MDWSWVMYRCANSAIFQYFLQRIAIFDSNHIEVVYMLISW